MACALGLSVCKIYGRPCINQLARQRSDPLSPAFMYRSSRMTTMRHAISATLLGCAALAHATEPPASDDQQWTRVDLDNAPALVIGAKPSLGDGSKTATTSKSGKPTASRKGPTSSAAQNSAAAKREVSTPAQRLPVSATAGTSTVTVEVGVAGSSRQIVGPAQESKPDGKSMPRVEPAQAPKSVEALSRDFAQPSPSTAAGDASRPKQDPATQSHAATTAGVAQPLSSNAASEAPSHQLQPEAQPVDGLVKKAGPLEPAQPPSTTAKVELTKVPATAKSAEVADAIEGKVPVTFSLSPKDRTIRAGLERWTASAGWKLSWELDDKFQSGGVVRFDADFGADFDSALSKLAGAMRSEVKTHAYLYVGNKVLRILEEPAKPVVQPAVPMTPVIPDGAQRDVGDRGLPYITRVKGYWLGTSGSDPEEAPPQPLPPIFNASVSLVFSHKASLATVTGILSKVTGIAIFLPGAIERSADPLFINDTPADKKKAAESKGRRTFVGSPRVLLDRISVSTGMLWEYKDETVVFTD